MTDPVLDRRVGVNSHLNERSLVMGQVIEFPRNGGHWTSERVWERCAAMGLSPLGVGAYCGVVGIRAVVALGFTWETEAMHEGTTPFQVAASRRDADAVRLLSDLDCVVREDFNEDVSPFETLVNSLFDIHEGDKLPTCVLETAAALIEGGGSWAFAPMRVPDPADHKAVNDWLVWGIQALQAAKEAWAKLEAAADDEDEGDEEAA